MRLNFILCRPETIKKEATIKISMYLPTTLKYHKNVALELSVIFEALITKPQLIQGRHHIAKTRFFVWEKVNRSLYLLDGELLMVDPFGTSSIWLPRRFLSHQNLTRATYQVTFIMLPNKNTIYVKCKRK